MNAAVVALALLAPAAPEPAAPDVSDSVRTGLKWLADQQKEDGSWTGNPNSSPTTVTAAAGLALLMEGSTPQSGTYAPHLRKTIAWFEKRADAEGKLAADTPIERTQFVSNHAQALLFLVCAHDADDNPERAKRLAPLIDKGIAFAVSCQTVRGGWGFASGRNGNDYDDGFCTTAVLHALFTARRAGFEVPKAATDNGVRYLVNATNTDGSVIYTLSGGMRPMGGNGYAIHTSAAAACLLTADTTRPAVLADWIRNARVTNEQFLRPAGNNALTLGVRLQMARIAYALGESGHARIDPGARDADRLRWSEYRGAAFKAVKDAQGKDGSWPDGSTGPVYTTAIALTVLQLDNGYLPAYSR